MHFIQCYIQKKKRIKHFQIMFNSVFYFCLAKIEFAQKVANWQLRSKFVVFWLVKFEVLAEMLPTGNSKFANWQLFEQFQFWQGKSEKSLLNIILKY